MFGWELPHSICGAVLRLPKGPLLDEYLAICRQRPLTFNVPWYPLRKRFSRQVMRVTRRLQGRLPPAPLLGPVTLTHLVRKHGLEKQALPQSVFYPCPPKKTFVAQLADSGFIESILTEDTVTLHLWRNAFKNLHGMEGPVGTWLQDRYRALFPTKANGLVRGSRSEREHALKSKQDANGAVQADLVRPQAAVERHHLDARGEGLAEGL
jgi:hypothetical protein